MPYYGLSVPPSNRDRHAVMVSCGEALPTVIPAPEPESRGGDVDSRLRGKDEEGALQAIFTVMTLGGQSI